MMNFISHAPGQKTQRMGFLCLVLLLTTATAQAQLDELGPEEMYTKGIELFTTGKFADCIPYFERMFEIFGNEQEYVKQMESVLYGLASARYNTGNFEAAIDDYTEFIKRYPGSRMIEEVHYRLGAAKQNLSTYEDAVADYRMLLEKYPGSSFSEDAAYQIAISYMASEKPAEAVTAFEFFVERFPGSDLAAQAQVYLGRAYFQSGELARAVESLEKAGNVTKTLDHIVYANFLAMEIGDAAFDETDYTLALRAFRRVRTSQSLILFQQKLVDEAKADLETSLRMNVPFDQLSGHFRREQRLLKSLDNLKQALDKLKAAGDYDATLFHRIGRCFYSNDRYWEARTAYERVVREAKDPALLEAAHFDLILALNRMRHFQDLIDAATLYLTKHGADEKLMKDGRVPAVAFMRAEAYVNMERFEEAEGEMAALEKNYPDHPQMARIKFYRALSIAMQERFPEAIELFQSWLSEHPDHTMGAEVSYWLPVSMFYGGQYDAAIPLFDVYVESYPMSVYAPEAAYRSALSKYSLEQYTNAAHELESWLEKYPDHVFNWEARVTLGDAYAAEGMLEEAKQAYLGAITPEAGPMEQLALAQIDKVFKALDSPENYRLMADTHIRFIQNNPNSGNMIESAYQAGWALRQLGRVDEARRLYWNCIERFGNNRTWEGFGPLLKDLRGMYRDQPPDALSNEYEALIEKARNESRRTLVARLVRERLTWTEMPDIERARKMYEAFLPESLDAEILAFMGNAFIKGGEPARGQELLELLLKDFPNSKYIDVAYARKAEALLASQQHQAALEAAEIAMARANDSVIMMEAVYSKAQALQALGKHREAIEEYNMVLASRATPRPLKPKAMLQAAASYEALGEWNVAIPYYQRIYVMYVAYEEEMAQAYLRSAFAFEKINDYVAAMKTCEEMLAVPALANRPELEEARKLLASLKEKFNS